MKWRKPAFEGNKLHAEIEFTGAETDKLDPEFGVVKCNVRVLNQNQELVMDVKTTLMIENKENYND